MRAISQKRINYLLEYLNKLAELKTFTAKQEFAVASSLRVSNGMAKHLIELGFVKRTGHGEYACIFDSFEPLQARVLAEKHREYNNKMKSGQQNTEVPVFDVKTSTSDELHTEIKTSEQVSEVQPRIIYKYHEKQIEKRSISILWGLIKINL